MEGNDPHGGHKYVCEGERARVGVSHGMVKVKLLCFRWLSPILKLVQVHFKFSSFPDELIHVSGFSRKEFCVL